MRPCECEFQFTSTYGLRIDTETGLGFPTESGPDIGKASAPASDNQA